MFKILIS